MAKNKLTISRLDQMKIPPEERAIERRLKETEIRDEKKRQLDAIEE